MMTRTHILTAFALLMVPLTAAAYVSPEEVLFSDSGQAFTAPPTHRTSGDKIDNQNLTSAQRRKQEQDLNYANQHPAAPAASSSAASSKPATLEDVLSKMQQTLEKLGEPAHPAAGEASSEEADMGMTIDNWEDPSNFENESGSTEVLHSGAPLNESGPGMWVAAIAIAGAVCWTMLKAKKGAFYKQ